LSSKEWRSQLSRITTDILIVGGGAAGMSAALAASSTRNRSVTIIDDNPRLGGQIWRAELGKTKAADATRLIKLVESGKIEIVKNAQVFASLTGSCLLSETPDGRLDVEYEKLIMATGARERFLPFPGWTLPNVCGAGGLQALVKGGLPVAGKRIVVSGTGPLLLAVADYLRSKNANVLAIAEQTSSTRLNQFMLGLWKNPAKALQGLRLRSKLRGVPYLTDCWVTNAEGDGKLESVTLTRNGKTWTVDCDHLAYGFHLVPNIELASLLGCEIENGFVAVDEFQRTSCENVYCAGEPTGIGGLEKSLIEGRIAGLGAAHYPDEASAILKQGHKARNFATRLSETFGLRDELRHLAEDKTIVCRCEDVEFGRLKEYNSQRMAKLQTRCGMGACQGRVCGSATEFLFGWEADTVRPPIYPIRMENL
jgi:NADPH-dependent 2,4-dienoyl-CoA reductase/sulfur reductase-like enzyme